MLSIMETHTLVSGGFYGNGKLPYGVLSLNVADLSRYRTLNPLLHLEWNTDMYMWWSTGLACLLVFFIHVLTYGPNPYLVPEQRQEGMGIGP